MLTARVEPLAGGRWRMSLGDFADEYGDEEEAVEEARSALRTEGGGTIELFATDGAIDRITVRPPKQAETQLVAPARKPAAATTVGRARPQALDDARKVRQRGSREYGGGTGNMSARSTYTDQEWQTLQFAPLAAFYEVAQVDRSISRLETGLMKHLTLVSVLTEPDANLAREVFGSIKNDFGGILKAFDAALGHSLTVDDVFKEFNRVLAAKASQSETIYFKELIRRLYVAIAEERIRMLSERYGLTPEQANEELRRAGVELEGRGLRPFPRRS